MVSVKLSLTILTCLIAALPPAAVNAALLIAVVRRHHNLGTGQESGQLWKKLFLRSLRRKIKGAILGLQDWLFMLKYWYVRGPMILSPPNGTPPQF